MCKRVVIALISSVVITTGWNPLDAASAQSATSATADDGAFFKQYCVGCHNDRLKTGGLSLEHVVVNDLSTNVELWEKILGKLERRAMPPVPARRPDEQTYSHVIAWLDGQLDHVASVHPNPGAPLLHRLNRA